MEMLNAGWQKHGNLLVYPHQWQRPAKTEEWVFDTLLEKKINSNYVEFISFPWATLIDLIIKKQDDRAKVLITALYYLPPRKTLFRVTACQHINIEVITKYLLNIKVTDLFWAHKTKNKKHQEEIRLYPLALYPYAFYEMNYCNFELNIKREYLYSFMGAYDKDCYISDVRDKIFKLKPNPRGKIIKRDCWHFENEVYKNQIKGEILSNKDKRKIKILTEEYSLLLKNSIYSLCPSGSGVNSIRLWESFAFGCIPIIFSPDYDFPNLSIELEYIYSEDDVCDFDFGSLNFNINQNIKYTPIFSLQNLFNFFSPKNLLMLSSKNGI